MANSTTHPENNSSDNVQLLAPDFDPDIDQDNQLTPTISTQDQPAESNIINAKDSKENNNQIHSSLQHPNWPDTSTVQIPTVSSTIPDQPPPHLLHQENLSKRQPPPTTTHIEEDEQQEPSINHHLSNPNTPSEREQI